MKLLLRIIPLIILLAAGLYFLLWKNAERKHKEEIRQIHQSEVQKAIQELSAEKLDRKKKAEEQNKLLANRKTEGRLLRAQLRELTARRSEVLWEIDRIRRPHLFRSRAKKETQLNEQFQQLNQLELSAASVRAKLAKNQHDIDSLSAIVGP